jgi:excisionase family DNA binding protein
MQEQAQWLTVKQAAQHLQCGPRVIYQAIRDGKLKAVRTGQAFRTHVDWIYAWLNTEAELVNPDAPGPALVYRPRQLH